MLFVDAIRWITRWACMQARRGPIPLVMALAVAGGPAAAQEQCASQGSGQFFNALHYCVSSVRAPKGGVTFGPGNVVRADLEGAWCGGEPGNGTGATITIRIDGGVAFRRLVVANGYGRTPSAYAANARIKTVEVTGGGGLAAHVRFPDRKDTVPVNLPAMAKDWIRLKIVDVYPGRRSSYACLRYVMPDFEYEEELLLRQQGVIK